MREWNYTFRFQLYFTISKKTKDFGMSNSSNAASEKIELLNNYSDHEKIAIECADRSFLIGIGEMQNYLRCVSSFFIFKLTPSYLIFIERWDTLPQDYRRRSQEKNRLHHHLQFFRRQRVTKSPRVSPKNTQAAFAQQKLDYRRWQWRGRLWTTKKWGRGDRWEPKVLYEDSCANDSFEEAGGDSKHQLPPTK